MFRFLRKFRQKAGERSSTAFWSFAIGEFVLVFLGILIALQVDNWNQGREDRRLERVLLQEMLSELKGDLEDISYNAQVQERLQNSNRVVLDFLQRNLPWHDSMAYHFAQIMGAGIFDYNASAFESLQSIGIDLIRNDSLRKQITGVYTVVYTHVKANESLLFDFLFDNLYPSLREHLHTEQMRESAVPVNLEALRLNNSFMEDLNNTIFIYQLAISANRRGQQAITGLIAAIEKELGINPETSK
jgi:hypothetical protein